MKLNKKRRNWVQNVTTSCVFHCHIQLKEKKRDIEIVIKNIQQDPIYLFS